MIRSKYHTNFRYEQYENEIYNIYDIIFNLFLTVRKRCFLKKEKMD